jgi:hypothetical protein
MKKTNSDRKATEFFFWYIFMMAGGLFFLASLLIEMPYAKWLDTNIPTWLAIINMIIFALTFIVASIPMRSTTLNYYLGIIFLLSALALKSSLKKELLVNGTIFLISVVLFMIFKYYFRTKRLKGDKKVRDSY